METFKGSAFEAFGEWEFGHDKNSTYVGVLKFDPDDGLELRVLDASGKEGFHAGWGAQPALKRVSVCGRTHSHGHISLFEGFLRSKPMSSYAPAETIYYFNRGLLGVATAEGATQRFSSVFATGDLLRVWLDQKLVSYDPLSAETAVTVTHTKPKSIENDIDGRTKLTLAWDRHGPTSTLAQASVEISARPWIGVKFAQPESVDHALREIDWAMRFISLLSGFDFSPSLFQLHLPTNHGLSETGNAIYFLGPRQQPKESLRDRIPMDLLLTYPNLETRFGQLAQAWFKLQREIPGCMNVFFSAGHSVYTNQRLFALTSVLEALHRHLTNGADRILRDRIKESLRWVAALSDEAVGDIDAFAARIVECRNLEAHCKEEGSQGSGSEQHRLASKLKAVIDALLLRHLGIELPDVLAEMKSSREYWFYASNDTWPWDKDD